MDAEEFGRDGADRVRGPVTPVSVAQRPGPGGSSTQGWLEALERSSRIGADPSLTLPRLVAAVSADHADRPALVGEQSQFTYAELATRMHAYAAWAEVEGLAKGDTVCLLMGNRPDYLAVWLGLSGLGITVALLNTNLAGAALAHCIDIAAPRGIIVAADLIERYESARPHLRSAPRLWLHGDPNLGIDNAIAGLHDAAGRGPREAVTLSDRALLIYTSGTTGLPKAANVSHHRIMSWSLWFAGLMGARPQDRMYDCLPLYHSVGGVVATGSMLASGGAVILREKFSASRFWDDVIGQDCTLFQYIGELCRYLVNAPLHPRERDHRLRLCAGNGLRGDVWERFQQRFAIPRILEFYAATEGTVSLYNVEGRVGAVGRVPSFMAHRSPAAIVRFDEGQGEPWRDAEGRCARVRPGEAGELIGRLASDPARAAQRFEGYTSEGESSRKVLRDVFAPGDAWLRTGDLMRQDESGFYYFVDRIGDTFRWKGENVATTEVAEALSDAPGVTEIAVYGVAVPGAEGRAGMAALTVTPDFDLETFRARCAERLPAYARPVFLRFRAALEITETFKQKKAGLAAEGFDPGTVGDALFFDDARTGRYAPLDAEAFKAIAGGRIRL